MRKGVLRTLFFDMDLQTLVFYDTIKKGDNFTSQGEVL